MTKQMTVYEMIAFLRTIDPTKKMTCSVESMGYCHREPFKKDMIEELSDSVHITIEDYNEGGFV